MSRTITSLLILLGVAWIGFSFWYGPDPNTSPILRYAMISLGTGAIFAIGIHTWIKKRKISS